jgi:hypothetical protein
MSSTEKLLRCFIWKAIESKGFRIPKKAYNTYNNRKHEIGLNLINNELPILFTSFRKFLSELYVSYPLYTNKLPYIAAFGYIQGVLIHELNGGCDGIKRDVGLSASIFNIGISLFDYMIDEFASGKEVFKYINYEFLVNVMKLSSRLSCDDIILFKGHNENLLVWIIIAFSISCKNLYQYCKNDRAWNQLSESIFELYSAEKLSCHLRINHISLPENQVLDVIRCKSVMPSLVTYFISEVACPANSKKEENNMKEICHIIGSIFWISDDLADIVKDLESRTPSLITIHGQNVINIKNDFFCNNTICGVLISLVESLLNLLDNLERELKRISFSQDTCYKVMEFVRMSIFTWIGEWL